MSSYQKRRASLNFAQARRQAERVRRTARLAGQDPRLLPFEAIRTELSQQNPLYEGLQQVRLEKIIGSLGRYRDFTRQFLPLSDSLYDRWTNVETLASRRGWPPAELFRVGDAYFVRDGNHRVAVARQMGNDTIEAYVWGFPDAVEIGPDDALDAVLIRLGERNFMEQTGLGQLRPDHGLRFTIPGRYDELLAQIRDLQNTLAVIDERDIPYQEAVESWYEMVYLPTVQIIRESTLLAEFPGRTETDLFAWLSKHRQELAETYGEGDLADWAAILAEKYREPKLKKIRRQARRLLGAQEARELEMPVPPAEAEEGED